MEFVASLRSVTNIGRVAIYHDGEWGTICSTGLTTKVVSLMCDRFGFSKSGYKTCMLLQVYVCKLSLKIIVILRSYVIIN